MRSLSRGRMVPRSASAKARRLCAAACCLLLVPFAGLSAAELVMRDLHAGASALPNAFAFTITTPNFTRSGKDSFDAGTALELGGRYSFSRVGDPFGLVIGIDANTQAYSYDSQDFMVAYGVRGLVGAGYAFSDDWTLTAEFGVSYGKTNLSLPASGSAPAFSADGTYHGFDLRVVGMYTITKRMLVSLQLGYQAMSHDLTSNQGDAVTLDIKGPYVGVGMTWRFSNAPERVE